MNYHKLSLFLLFITCAAVSMDIPQPVRLTQTFGKPISQPFAEAKQAIQKNDVEKIRTLLKTNPNILKQTDNVGQTLLTWTIITGIQENKPINLTIFELLLDAGINVKNPNYLILLAEKNGEKTREGSLEAIRLLIGKGTNINGTNVNKDTALIKAADKGNLEAVKLLLHHGSGPRAADNLRIDQRSYMSLLPDDLTKIVSQYGIDPNIKDAQGKTALDLARKGLAFTEEMLKSEWALNHGFGKKTYKEAVDLMESQKKNYQEIINLLEPITNKSPKPK